MSAWVIGQAPSSSSDPARPLSGRSGGRLAELAGVPPDALGTVFKLRNLLGEYPGASERKGDLFDPWAARDAATKLTHEFDDGDRVVLLGRAVGRAFGYRDTFFVWRSLPRSAVSVRAVVIPHTSSANLLYNSPAIRQMAMDVLRPLVDQEVKSGS